MSLIPVGATFPRQGTSFAQRFGEAVLRLGGWRLEGEIPDVAKAIIIGAPHNSNWDFVFGMAAKLALRLQVSWLGKHTLFRWPFGGFMRRLGGVPLDRRKSQGLVDQTIALFEERSRFILGIAPEGTRRKVDRWKLGFYHIAHGAGVPILPIYFDYRRKVLGIGPLISTTGTLDADLDRIYAFYEDRLGTHPLA